MFKNSGITKCKILKNKISQFHLEAVETGVVQKKTNLIGYSGSGAAFMAFTFYIYRKNNKQIPSRSLD